LPELTLSKLHWAFSLVFT